MTTAHRPTWKAAVGRASEGGYASISTLKSVRDEAGHTKLKLREGPQVIGPKHLILQESLAKLEHAELRASELLRRAARPTPVNLQIEAESRNKLLLHDKEVDEDLIKNKYDDADEDSDNDTGGGKDEHGHGGWSDIDSDLDSDSSNSQESDDSEDEEAALQAELAKIKQEREALKLKENQEQALKDEEALQEAALTGNPLLNSSASARLKRKWNDDVVFRNQAKTAELPKRFINDTVRNDFHKRFLNKFIR